MSAGAICRRFDYYYDERSATSRRRSLRRTGAQTRSIVALARRAGRFVTTDSGTGVVHQAPAFGEVDFRRAAGRTSSDFATGEGPQLICAVGPDGKFTAEAPDYQGRWVKEADKDISRELRHRGLLYHQEQYLHEYPFCWRAEEDPLIQYPRKSWFIRTTAVQRRDAEEQPANQLAAGAHPRRPVRQLFGIERRLGPVARALLGHAAADLGLRSRPATWKPSASYDELLAKPGVQGTEVWEAAKRQNPELSDHLKVHKPYIDAVTYDSRPACRRTRMRRVPDVIDCWFDSGAMPFAQWGYPHQGREKFREQFPADFISEAIDQTRGWFYSQLAISTLLFRDPEADSATNSRAPPIGPRRRCRSVSQLHRARADAGRRRPEDVEEQAELPRAERNLRPLRGRRPALVFLRQPAPVDVDPLQRTGDQGQHSRVPAAAVERLQLLRDLRQHRRLRSGRRAQRAAGDAGELEPAVLAQAKNYPPRRTARRIGSLDSERTASHRRRRHRGGWTPTTTSPPAGRSPSSSMP